MKYHTKEDMRLLSFELPEKLLFEFEKTVEKLNVRYDELLIEAIEDFILKYEGTFTRMKG